MGLCALLGLFICGRLRRPRIPGVLLVLLFLPWIERIPEPVLAAIVIHAVSKSLRLSVFRPYFHWRRDRLVTVTAVAAVLIFGMLDGLLAARKIALRVARLKEASRDALLRADFSQLPATGLDYSSVDDAASAP